MTLAVDFWQLLLLLLGFGGVLLTAGKVLARQFERGVTQRFGQIEKGVSDRFALVEKQADQWQALERDFLKFQAELAVHYVRREDYVRGQTVIEAKLDAIASELKLVQIKGGAS